MTARRWEPSFTATATIPSGFRRCSTRSSPSPGTPQPAWDTRGAGEIRFPLLRAARRRPRRTRARWRMLTHRDARPNGNTPDSGRKPAILSASELHPEHHLNVARAAGAGDPAEGRGCGNVGGRGPQNRVVEQVKGLQAEAAAQSLPNGELLFERRVQVIEPGRSSNVPAQV